MVYINNYLKKILKIDFFIILIYGFLKHKQVIIMKTSKELGVVITTEDLEQAKFDPKLAESIIKKILYDGSNNKLRLYLYKSGLQTQDAEDLESDVIYKILTIIKNNKFTHNKIPFERWMWNEIWHMVMNHFQSKKLKKNKSNNSLEGMLEGFEECEPQDWMGTDCIDEFELDVENLFTLLTQRQAFMCRCIYYNDWNQFEIQDYLGINKTAYGTEIEKIRLEFSQAI